MPNHLKDAAVEALIGCAAMATVCSATMMKEAPAVDAVKDAIVTTMTGRTAAE